LGTQQEQKHQSAFGAYMPIAPWETNLYIYHQIYHNLGKKGLQIFHGAVVNLSPLSASGKKTYALIVKAGASPWTGPLLVSETQTT